MKMEEKDRIKFLEVVKSLIEDKDKKIVCPVCQKACLEVFDMYFSSDDELMARVICCPVCGANTDVRMSKR